MSEKKKVAFISVLAAIFLTGTKLVVGLLTNSLGILSEALHSGLDLVAAIITLFAVKSASKDADNEHRYGHGKIENFSALAETSLLFITCFWICYEAIKRLVTGEINIEVTIYSFIVVILSIIIDTWRSKKLMRVAKKYKSQALEADALHFSTDIWSSSVVLFGLICVLFGKYLNLHFLYYADAVSSLMVATIVIYVSYKLSKKSIDILMDKSPEEIDTIENIIKNFNKIVSYHSFKMRQSGHMYYIDFTIHVDNKYSIIEAHNICEELEEEIKKIEPNSLINVHIEPFNHK